MMETGTVVNLVPFSVYLLMEEMLTYRIFIQDSN